MEVSFMTRIRFLAVLGMLVAVIASQGAFAAPAQDTGEKEYEVLSPWAEVDPIPLKGISDRIDTLSGKKIGLFANYKRAAMPIARSLERRLSAMYPNSETRLFHSPRWNVTESETENADKFEAWAKGVDAVILVVGD
jgi:hypothetical protein